MKLILWKNIEGVENFVVV